MPSKNNKKLAAAERAAKLRAETEAAAAANPAVADAPVENSAPAAETSEESPPCAELTALSVQDSSPTNKHKLPAFKPPPPLSKLTQSNSSVLVVTNSYPMEIKNNKNYRYNITVTKFNKGEQKELVGAKGASRQQQDNLFKLLMLLLEKEKVVLSKVIYDGAQSFYTAAKITLPRDPIYIDSKDLPPPLKNGFFPRNETGSLTITIEPNDAQPTVNTIDVLNETQNGTSNFATQMLQTGLSQEAKKDTKNEFTVIDGGSEMFHTPAPENHGRNGVLELDGISGGIKVAEGKNGNGAAHVILDHKKKRFFASLPLEELNLDFNDKHKTSRFLNGLRVRTTYSNQTFIMHGLSDIPMSKITFDGKYVLEDAAKMAKRDTRTYNMDWPAVQTKIWNEETKVLKTYSFPIENLILLPNQKLNQKHGNPPSCALPHERFASTQEVGRKAHLLTPNATLQAFGATIHPNPITVDAVPVPAPTIVYNGGTTSPNPAKQTKWDIPRGARFIEPANIPYFLILYNTDFLPRSHAGTVPLRAEETLNGLKSTAQGLGIKLTGMSRIENLADHEQFCHASSPGEALKWKLESLRDLPFDKKPAVIYIDHSSSPTHGGLKLQERLCGVVTQQLAIDKSLRQTPRRATLENIVLKLNKKFGGLNHKVIPDPMIAHLYGNQSNTLIISYDVCHSSGKVYAKGEFCDEPSCVGFAYNATKNPEYFIGDFAYQLTRQERVEKDILEQKIVDIFLQYRASRNKIPSNIVILRDGVSEGQHQMVYDDEFAAINGALKAFIDEKNKQYNMKVPYPSMALFIITKRHGHRLYVKNGDAITNIPPLIAVDRTIVKKAGNELIFNSHFALKGTAKALVVNSIVNEKVFSRNDEVVRLLAALCCAHQVSTNIVSLPESIYAADEYAKRGADIFQSWKIYKDSKGEPIPTIMTEDGLQNDWAAITQELCYAGSVFNNIRIT